LMIVQTSDDEIHLDLKENHFRRADESGQQEREDFPLHSDDTLVQAKAISTGFCLHHRSFGPGIVML